MDYVHYTWVREHVQHCLKDVREEMQEFAEELGKITGTAEKERREQATLLRNLEALLKEQNKLIEAQRKTIEAQDHRIRSIEAMFGQPREAGIVDFPGRRLS
jgi:uncharacterized protein HemX